MGLSIKKWCFCTNLIYLPRSGLVLHTVIFNFIHSIKWTFWIVIGTYLEDRDLHREFGSQYLEYSSRVPMLIPCRIPRNKPV